MALSFLMKKIRQDHFLGDQNATIKLLHLRPLIHVVWSEVLHEFAYRLKLIHLIYQVEH